MFSKFDWYKNGAGDLIIGIVFMIISILLFVGRTNLYKDVINIVVLILLLLSVFQLIRFFYKKQSVKESSKTFLSCVFNLIVSLIFFMLPDLPLGLLPVLFSIYLFLLGTAQFVMYYVFFKNRASGKMRNLLWGFIYYSISLPILFAPLNRISNFLLCLSLYTFLLSLNFIYDFVNSCISKRTKDNLKRKIRITLPVLIEAIIPYSVMVKINKSLEPSLYKKHQRRRSDDTNMSILIHTSNRGVNKFGHIDIIFDGKVISYGNYDEGSRSYLEFFGDGVMFTTESKSEYINFCIDNSKKTLFEFKIYLNNKQYKKVKEKIESIMKDTIEWDCRMDKRYDVGRSYAAKLYKKTKATFYKFKSGKYKTYFVLGTNCCYLADDIIAKSGTDILSLNGIITPGTYYDYLEKELYRKGGIVVSKSIYNEYSRAIDE